MTAHALELGVRPVEREFCIARVIELDVEPFRRSMAGRAFDTVDAGVGVVVTVARDTLRIELLFELVTRMTRFAHQPRVSAREREARAREVIERRLGPVRRRVTVPALGAVRAHVRIVFAMAIDALIGRVDVLLVGVAAHAGCTRVRAREGVAVLELVIVMSVVPGRLGMAVGARLAQVTAMLVVVAVTRDALGFRIVKRSVRLVTVRAHELGVAVAQGEIGQGMIESRDLEAEYVGVASFVIRMAARTIRVADLDLKTVEPCVTAEVLRDVRVASDAQIVLALAVEPRVTRCALRFVFGMGRNDGARHHEPLEASQLRARVHANARCSQQGGEDYGASLDPAHD